MSQRILAIDVVRGVALFGVLVVNLITAFRVSIFQQFLGGPETGVERIVDFALESKAFALFSLLFGIGLAIQHERLQVSGRAMYFLSRRLLALLAFGLLHLLFIWNGDILAEYAIAGFVVLPFLHLPAERLAKAALAFLGVFFLLAFLPSPLRLPDAIGLERHVAAATDVYANGSYPEIWWFSLGELRLMLPLHVNVFARTVALMLLGAASWKSGLLGDLTEESTAAKANALDGRPANGGIARGGTAKDGAASGSTATGRGIAVFSVLATVAGLALTAVERPAIISGMLAPIVLCLGYGALIYTVARQGRPRFILMPLAALGRMAFTNYILQSVVFSFIFFGYGAGQFGKMGAAHALVLGGAVYVGQIILSTVWLRHFRHGPLEWLWRVLMHGRKPA